MLPLLLLLARLALAEPPLISVADVADPRLEVWWREGDLLVTLPTATGRTGLRPLQDRTPVDLPAELQGWKRVDSPCQPNPGASARIDDQVVTAEVIGDAADPVVRLRAGDAVLASHALGRPARTCAVLLLQADTTPMPELVVVWELDTTATDGTATTIRGVRAFTIPDTAR